MKKNINKILVFATIFFALCGNPTAVFADDEGVSLVFGPTSQRVTLTPGETYHGEVYISNPATALQNTDYILYVTPYGVSNSNYDPVFDQETAYTQIVDWITLDKTEGSVAPNDIEYVGFTIDVPANAPAGGQYATIMAQDVTGLDESNEQGGGLSISNITAVGSIVIADVMGETHEDGEVIENNLPGFLFSDELSASALVKNNGNVHADASYILQVWPLIGGEEICTNEEEPTKSLIMPNTERYHTESCKLPPVGIFRAKQTVKLFDEISTAERLVVVCPIWLLFIVLFAVILLIMWLVVKARSRKKAD